MALQPVGRQNVTASAVLGVSGKPVMVVGWTQISKATGAGLVQLFNGVDASGSELAGGSGVPNDRARVDFPGQGKFFPNGCYVQIDSDVSAVDVDYYQVTT